MTTRGPTQMKIAKGELVNCNGQEYVILRVVDLSQVLAKCVNTKEVELLEIRYLSPWVVKNQDVAEKKDIDLLDVAETDWEEARRRLEAIRPMLYRQERGSGIVARISKETGYSPATLYRWRDYYSNSGLLTSLLPTKRSGGQGKGRISQEVEAIIEHTLENFYLTDQKQSIKETVDKIQGLCEKASLPQPHWNTVKNRINWKSARENFEKRFSKRAAKQIFDVNEGTIPNAEWPLALVQIDHTPLPIMIVHDVDRHSIGRPYVTFSIDVYSRVVTGMELSLEAPSAMSAGLCLSHAILPKEKWLSEDIGLPDVSWPVYGVFGILHMDNAREFRGEMLKEACREYGIDPQFRPVKTPHYGGHIERWMGTASQKLKTLEGATFANPKERGEYDSEERAIMTFHDLEQWLVLFIAKYHRSPHAGIDGEAPIDRYRKGLLGGDGKLPRGLPMRRLDEEKVRIDFMPFIERTVQSYGVVIDDVYYFSDILRPWVNAPDPKNAKLKRLFKFRRDPHDISRLYFLDPTSKKYFIVPYRNTSFPPISIWDFKAARKAAKSAGIKDINENVIFSYATRQQEIQEQAGLKTKAARREDQRRTQHAKARKKREKDLPKTMKTEAPAMPPVIPGYDPNRKSHFDDDE
ncbi:transposon Tn7 transposition protein TnsB [mine drainage metagenome]|uniref:Transposon Tn7 transposition protein TnsB n=1 Tax=mine drainage metagenome TaxID=410659 RepID=A0A1J5R3E6_9ZZZZ